MTRVLVFKRDLFGDDLLCMEIDDCEGSFEIDEGMDGWESLVKKLPGYLPGATSSSDWYDEVVQPAFAANVTKIYSRPSDEPIKGS